MADPTATGEAGGTPIDAGGASAQPTADQIRAQVRAELLAELKAATGHESLEALKAARDAAEQERLAEQGKFKELAESRDAELKALKAERDGERVRNAILAAASESIDPGTVEVLLVGKAKIGADGAVTVDGKPAAEAVAELLKAKPHLAKPSQSQGSGTPAGGAETGGKTMTRAAFEALDPAARAAHIKAGGTLTD